MRTETGFCENAGNAPMRSYCIFHFIMLFTKIQRILFDDIKKAWAKWRTRIRTTNNRLEQRKSFRETGRTSLSFKTLMVYTLGLRMQYRGVYKEECSMKKVCAALFLIILLLAAIVPVSAAGTLR